MKWSLEAEAPINKVPFLGTADCIGCNACVKVCPASGMPDASGM